MVVLIDEDQSADPRLPVCQSTERFLLDRPYSQEPFRWIDAAFRIGLVAANFDE